MSTEWTFAVSALFSYLLGSIPFGLLIARSRGVDIRQMGSGNIGATNVLRALGKGPGITTFVLDVLKGFVPTCILPLLCRDCLPGSQLPALAVVSGACAIAGHNWPVYLRFKGGKGVATSAGTLLGIAPLAVLSGLIAWFITFKLSRYVSLASLVAALAVGCTGWAQWHLTEEQPILVPVVLSILCLLIVLRHRANIQRLLNGTENRFVPKKERQE